MLKCQCYGFLEVLGIKLGLVLRATDRTIRRVAVVFVGIVRNGMVTHLVINDTTHRRGGKERCPYEGSDALPKRLHLNDMF